jgi:hypothetical protein
MAVSLDRAVRTRRDLSPLFELADRPDANVFYAILGGTGSQDSLPGELSLEFAEIAYPSACLQ